jgi:hypothetical protein
MSVWTVVLVVFVLRLGPLLAFEDDKSYDGECERESGGMDESEDTVNEDSQHGNREDEAPAPLTREEQLKQSPNVEEEEEVPPRPDLAHTSSLSTAEPNVQHLRPRLTSRHQRMRAAEEFRESIRIQKKPVPSFHSD